MFQNDELNTLEQANHAYNELKYLAYNPNFSGFKKNVSATTSSHLLTNGIKV